MIRLASQLGDLLDRIVVIIVFIVVIHVLCRTHRFAVVGVANLDSPVHVGELDPRSAPAELGAQFMTYPMMTADMQAKVILYVPRHRGCFNLRFRVRRQRN